MEDELARRTEFIELYTELNGGVAPTESEVPKERDIVTAFKRLRKLQREGKSLTQITPKNQESEPSVKNEGVTQAKEERQSVVGTGVVGKGVVDKSVVDKSVVGNDPRTEVPTHTSNSNGSKLPGVDQQDELQSSDQKKTQ